MFRAGEYKERAEAGERRIKELESEIANLRSQMTPEMVDAALAKKRVAELNQKAEDLSERVDELNFAIGELAKAQKEKEALLVTFDDEILVQEFGLYRPRFDFAESSHFKDRLSECR